MEWNGNFHAEILILTENNVKDTSIVLYWLQNDVFGRICDLYLDNI